MNRIIAFIFFIVLTSFAWSQDINQIKWSYKIVEKKFKNTKISVQAIVPNGWYLIDSISKIDEVEKIKFQFSPTLQYALSSNLSITKVQDHIFNKGLINVLEKQNSWTFNIASDTLTSLVLDINYALFSKNEFLTETKNLHIVFDSTQTATQNIVIENFNYKNPLVTSSDIGSFKGAEIETYSIWKIFVLGLLGGLISLLTPCVFPLIPLTLSFFSKNSSRKEGIKRAVIYGSSILVIYFLISVPFHLISNFSPDFFNNLSSNVYLNSFFFILMILFGLSFLGAFEITLPSWLVNFSDSKANKNNFFGIFFMALTLCIVSFSCTGPILGTLLVNTLNNETGATSLSVGLLGFGMGIGLPFALLSLSPNLLKSLPKSGKWLIQIKILLAVLEFLLAVKFLSNVDLVLHLGILKREYILITWATLLIAYMLYIIKIPQIIKGIKVTLSKKRMAVASILLLFSIYLLYGVTERGYKKITFYNWLSNGLLPPHFYSIYNGDNLCALNFDCVKDYQQGLALARQINKPILLDFTGWTCVNCRKVEENIWVNPQIYNILKNEFIIVSLYVDDRTQLETPIVISLNGEDKILRTIGEKWSYFQILNFKSNSQPLYAIMTPNEKLVNTPIAYTSDIEEYKNWLMTGLNYTKTQ